MCGKNATNGAAYKTRGSVNSLFKGSNRNSALPNRLMLALELVLDMREPGHFMNIAIHASKIGRIARHRQRFTSYILERLSGTEPCLNCQTTMESMILGQQAVPGDELMSVVACGGFGRGAVPNAGRFYPQPAPIPNPKARLVHEIGSLCRYKCEPGVRPVSCRGYHLRLASPSAMWYA